MITELNLIMQSIDVTNFSILIFFIITIIFIADHKVKAENEEFL